MCENTNDNGFWKCVHQPPCNTFACCLEVLWILTIWFLYKHRITWIEKLLDFINCKLIVGGESGCVFFIFTLWLGNIVTHAKIADLYIVCIEELLIFVCWWEMFLYLSWDIFGYVYHNVQILGQVITVDCPCSLLSFDMKWLRCLQSKLTCHWSHFLIVHGYNRECAYQKILPFKVRLTWLPSL